MRDPFRRLIDQHLPAYDVRSIEPMGEGLDNVAFLVNDELVVRQAKAPDPDAIRREVAVLGLVARHSTLPVPNIDFADPQAGILAYRHIPGQPLMDVPDADALCIAGQLGGFLRDIHAIPLADVDGILPLENDPLREWLDEARSAYGSIDDHLPASARERIEAFLDQPLPHEPERFTFCHNDFGAEHILVDPGSMQLTGVIDWTDAAIADPVRDLALILRDLGPAALQRALDAYGSDLNPDEYARLVFHARCKLIEDIAFGLDTGSAAYLDAALTYLDWTLQGT